MSDSAKIAIRASTQEHLDIEDIKEGIVILKDGGAALILATTAINFGLLSEKEQEATIFAYASLLNSLTFPVQIVVRSSLKDISSYIRLIEEQEAKEKRRLIREQLGKYKVFVQETVQKNKVLDKKFYIVIPMSSLELGVTKTLITGLTGRKTLPFDKDYILQKAKVNLYPKRDHLLRLLNRLSIKGRQLETQELIKLFFDIYNPESLGQQVITTEQYQAPLVQSTVKAKPASAPVQPKQEEVSEAKDSQTSRMPTEESVRDQIDNLVKESIAQPK